MPTFFFFVCSAIWTNVEFLANTIFVSHRYPDDVYDRRWFDFFLKSWTEISATLIVNNDNEYDPPKKALATAATPSNASAPLTLSWTPANPGDQYYLYSHFAEIQDLQTNDTREFELFWNGAVIIKPFIPSKLAVDTHLDISPRTCKGGKCIYQLIKTARSTLPPLLNALEVYTVIQFPQSETNENDGMLLTLQIRPVRF